MSNEPLHEQFRLLGIRWADACMAADMLEHTKSAVLAQMTLQYADLPVNRAEQKVKASPEWKEHIQAMVTARRNANVLKVEFDAARMRFQERSSEEANRRAEMRAL